MKRRELFKIGAGAVVAGAGASTLIGCSSVPAINTNKSAVARVVVVGGGPGGISSAQAIKATNPGIDVTIVEKNAKYSTCFASNWVLADIATMDDITFGYNTLKKKHKINVVQGEVTGIDADKRTVSLADGSYLEYDRLVVSPGISFRWDTIEGLDESTSTTIAHAWKAGPQTALLKKQLNAMPHDGTFVMCAPPNPFRCPPGPYERVSMIATYLKKNKPKAKIVILDAKDKFSKFGLFKEGWRKNYGFESDNSMIDWVSKSNGGAVKAVDAKTKTITTMNGDKIKADVINYIPAQKANTTAVKMGLVNTSGWCPVDQETFESTMVKNVHVLGDASIAKPIPKSGFAADSQGKVCGAAVANLLSGKAVDPKARFANQCFSLVAPTYGISVAAGYRLDGKNKIGKTGGGLFPRDGNFTGEAQSAHAWYTNITASLFK